MIRYYVERASTQSMEEVLWVTAENDYGMGFSYGLIQGGEGSFGLLCATCILGTNLICQRFGIVPSITRQLFIRPEYEKEHTIYQRFSYTRDDLIR